MARRRRYDTDIVHAGETRDPSLGLTPPIARSAPFVFPTIEELDDTAAGRLDRCEYIRMGHPLQRVVERKIAALEGADDALVLGSGMAAVCLVYLGLLNAGDHLLVTDDGYKRTLTFARDTLPRWGITGELIDARDPLPAVAAAWRETTRLVLTEMPTNPHLRVIDLPALAELVHARGGLLIVDSTIASPICLRPLEHGADLVVHSATKFLAGHNDVLCGAVAGRQELLDPLRELHKNLGAVLDPEGCYLLNRGLKTLRVRVEREMASAGRLAAWLAKRPEVKEVFYPGLPDHPHHAVAARDMDGFGAMLSFTLDTDLAGVSRFIAALETICHGTSLGGVETLCLHLWSIMRHGLTPADDRLQITPDLVRLSVGLEDPDDLLEDLERGLAALRGG